MGRKTKLTKTTQDDICAALEIGATYEAAAANADISYESFRKWRNAGEQAEEKQARGEALSVDDKRYLAFVGAIRHAKATALLMWQQKVHEAAQIDPQWAWRMLQVRAPEEYSIANKMEIGGHNGPVEVVIRYEDSGHTA